MRAQPSAQYVQGVWRQRHNNVSTREGAVSARIVEVGPYASTSDIAVGARSVEAATFASTGEGAVDARIVEVVPSASIMPA